MFFNVDRMNSVQYVPASFFFLSLKIVGLRFLFIECVACYAFFCPVSEKKVKFIMRKQWNHEKVFKLCNCFDVLADFGGSNMHELLSLQLI